MPATGVRVTHGGRDLDVDLRDVRHWYGSQHPADPADPAWTERAHAYVGAHPRPPAGVSAAQRLALLRRLAAGPASADELRAAMRRTGWVAASDLENRLRDLRAADSRTGGYGGLPVERDGERLFLSAPLPDLDEPQRQALAFAKTVVAMLDGPMAVQASATLDALLPGVSSEHDERPQSRYRAPAADLQRFDRALRERRPLRVRYFSMNSGREREYELVPVEYVTVGPVLKALCVPVDAGGHRTDQDKQFALDRLITAELLTDWVTPAAETIEPQRADIVLDVSDGLYEVMRQRNLFGIRRADAQQLELEVWRVHGSFATALAWDVMEQLCAWSGSVQVHRPLWLVNAVCRRLRAGLRVMETGAEFVLVKPDVGHHFDSPGLAVSWEEAAEYRRGPRRIPPPR